MASRKKKEIVVKAAVPFADARTGKNYQRGDVVVGWEKERAEHYAAIGLVHIVEPKKEDPQMKLEEAPKPKPKPKKEPVKDDEEEEKEEEGEKETAKKPGPSETKPKRGASKKK